MTCAGVAGLCEKPADRARERPPAVCMLPRSLGRVADTKGVLLHRDKVAGIQRVASLETGLSSCAKVLK